MTQNLQDILLSMGELDALISLYAEKVEPIINKTADYDTFAQLCYNLSLICRLSRELRDNIDHLATDELLENHKKSRRV